jgi:hypothetical protein
MKSSNIDGTKGPLAQSGATSAIQNGLAKRMLDDVIEAAVRKLGSGNEPDAARRTAW